VFLGESDIHDKQKVIQQIYDAFSGNDYPGDNFLQGSFDGCEPYDVIQPFQGRTDWQQIDPALLDAQYDALSFFSEAGLRFFLPAYLIADLRDELQTADPLLTLTHGFSDQAINVPTQAGVFVRKTGKSSLVNPNRYGATTFYDYACWRLSIFTREEAEAIVAYLTYKRDTDPYHLHEESINAALNLFWLDRAANAPSVEALKQHLKSEADFLAAIASNIPDGD